ncbi:unnamed protein product [Bursaphelenchus xylophilus]|uniref:(pine wood nematode) hypothetical protein n=1 Tax=Bursaphelenchus xylophilus TaxID=6326 RepID=A0A1I7RJL6_BURXY|nr:unnamed protein product [Bursaphelenchus xylophilus]CAG9128942.1 unnamed protein product [Bursaphelenchus xylophilus]
MSKDEEFLWNAYHKLIKTYKAHHHRNEQCEVEIKGLEKNVIKQIDVNLDRIYELALLEEIYRIHRCFRDDMKQRVESLHKLLDEFEACKKKRINFEISDLFQWNFGDFQHVTLPLQSLQIFLCRSKTETTPKPTQCRFIRMQFSSERKRKPSVDSHSDIPIDFTPNSRQNSRFFKRKTPSRRESGHHSGIEQTIAWLHRLNELESEKSVELWQKVRSLERLERFSSEEYLDKMAAKLPTAWKRGKLERRRLFLEKLDLMSQILNQKWADSTKTN